jgi:hypothetical protein
MFTSRCAFSKSPGESSFLTGACRTDPWPQRTGCDNWSWPRWHWSPRTGADAFLGWPMKQANTTALYAKKNDSLSQQKDSVQVWKRIQITLVTLITLACDCCRLKGIWDMSGSKWSLYGTYILLYIVMFLDVYINSTAWSAWGFVFV